MRKLIISLLCKLPNVWHYYYNGREIVYVWAFGRKWEIWK